MNPNHVHITAHEERHAVHVQCNKTWHQWVGKLVQFRRCRFHASSPLFLGTSALPHLEESFKCSPGVVWQCVRTRLQWSWLSSLEEGGHYSIPLARGAHNAPLLRVHSPQSYLPVVLLRFRLAQLVARTDVATSSVRHFSHVPKYYATCAWITGNACSNTNSHRIAK